MSALFLPANRPAAAKNQVSMSILRFHWPIALTGALLIGMLGGAVESSAQPDSVRAEILKEKGFSPDHSARNALWRGAVLPGWGQLYNRQFYKIPFVFAGFAGLGFRVYRSQTQYKLFQQAHLFGIGRKRSGENEPNPYQHFEEEYNRVINEEFVRQGRSETRELEQMRNQREQYRRQRDLALLGTGLFYALTLLDAYVSAHLLSFDVGGNLSVRVHPLGPTDGGRRVGRATSGSLVATTGMHIRMRF